MEIACCIALKIQTSYEKQPDLEKVVNRPKADNLQCPQNNMIGKKGQRETC